MKRCLVDVNVILPLLVRHHEHRELALAWFDRLRTGEAGLCRFVQLALMSLLANPSIMGEYALTAPRAWSVITELLADERVEYLPEPDFLDAALPRLLNQKVPTGKLVGDAYLAAFAIAGQLRLTTLDRGFRRFRQVDLDLLVS